jgi:hypothetical protein
MAKCIKTMQDELGKQETGVWQGRSCGPYLFNIFSNGITAYMSEEKLQVQAMEKQIISAVLLSDK